MKKVFLPFAAMLLLLVIGCSEQKSTTPDSSADLTENPTVDPTAAVLESAGTDWSQPELAPTFQTQLDSIDTSYDAYALVFIWGQCANKYDSVRMTTDWSGSLSMNAAGSMRVKRVIRFEPGQDTLYPPTDSQSVSWGSVTTLDVDGLGLVVLVKRGVVYAVAPTISFTTTPFSIEIPVGDLAKLNLYQRIDDHNGIVIFARQLPRRHCPQGGVLGVWHRDSTSWNGPFEGIWLRGEPFIWPLTNAAVKVGKVHGRFFTTDDFQHLFRGRYTDPDGVEVGDVFGTWFYDDPTMCPMCGAGHARFKGRFTRDGQGEIGTIEGELGFGFGPTIPKTDMPLHGRWRVDCPPAGEPNTDNSAN